MSASMNKLKQGATLALTVLAVASMPIGAALAEGNGDPFPPPDTSITMRVEKPVFTGKNQDPFPFSAPAPKMSLSNYKPLPAQSQDPFPFHAPARVVALHAPVSGPNPSTAAADDSHGITTPMASRPIGQQGGPAGTGG